MKILLCTDGSKMSDKATRKAAELSALVKNAEVTVLYVLQPVYPPPPYGIEYTPIEDPTHFREKTKQEGKEILENAAKILREFDVKHETLLLEGHPASTIIDYAANHSFDLLMIGNKGRTGLEKILMGSVSSTVVQGANCDVWVVK